MTKWLDRTPAHRRIIVLFWLLNVVIAVALLAFTLRNWF